MPSRTEPLNECSLTIKSLPHGSGKPSDPPPRAARPGAASGVEGPGRAQRQRREHDRPYTTAQRKEQHLSWIERRPPEP